MTNRSNFAGNIAYDDLREWLAMAERLGEVRTVKGANCEEDIGLAAEAVLRAENGPCVVFEDIPGCAKGSRLLLNVFAGTRRNMTLGFPDAPHQVGVERRLSRSLSAGAAHHPARDRRRRPGARKRHDGRRRRRHQVSGAEMAREGRRQLHRHRHLHHHARSRGELAQCRRLPRAGARQEDRRHGDGGRPSRPHPPRQVVQARRAAAVRHGAGRRSDRVLLRRAGSALRRVRARPRRRPARQADQDGARQGHRACPSRPTPRSCSKASCRPTAPMPKGRSASGPAIMPAACARSRCSTSRRSITATIRSCSACRRWAAGPDEMARYRAVMRSATIKQNVANAGVPGRAAGVVPRGRRRAHVPRGLDHPALSRPRGSGRACRRAMRRIGLRVEIHRGGRRRCRRHQSRPAAVGDADPHRSQGIDPVHHRLMGFERRSGAAARAARGRRHDPFGGADQRLQAMALA